MKFLKISIFVILFWFFTNAFALSATSNIYLDKASEDKLEIHWDTVEWAEVYGVSYWKTSGMDKWYEHELEILVWEEAKAKIDNLDPNSKYYIAVKSYDSDNNESDYSKEVSFSTSAKIEELKNTNTKVIDTRNVEINFNVDLKKDSQVDVVINNTKDDLENVEVEKYTVDWNKLSLFLSNDLKLWNKYSITIISLEWVKWEKINAWVDWIIEFEVDKDTIKYSEQTAEDLELQSADVTNNSETWTWIKDNNIKEKNTDNKDVKNIESKENLIVFNKVLWGSDISNSDDKKIIESVAKKKKDLPQTWPVDTLLFLMFSFIAGWLFLILRRRLI